MRLFDVKYLLSGALLVSLLLKKLPVVPTTPLFEFLEVDGLLILILLLGSGFKVSPALILE
jgi:hypothetical protein